MRRVLSLVLATTVLAVLAGCGGDGDGRQGSPETAASAGPVKAMSHADALKLAGKYRDEAVATTGATLSGEPTSGVLACEGPHTFTASTYGDVPVPAEQQVAVLDRMRQHYATAKYEVVPPSGDGALQATGPDRVKVTATGDGAGSVRINVATPCYSSDEPL